MICPKCEYEYVDGITVCADCGTKLIDKSEFEGHLVHPSDWQIVYTTGESYKAQMLKANLEGAGIECTLLQQNDSSFPTVGDLSVIKLLVRKSDSENALEIINDIENSEFTDEEE